MKGLHKTAMVLAALGAINWGLVQFNWDLVEILIGSWSSLVATIVYYLIGLSGVWLLVKTFK